MKTSEPNQVQGHMPSMAMEPLGASRSSSLALASFRSAGASSTGSRHESHAARERRLASERQEEDDHLRRSLVSKASAVCRIAELMNSQNELMLSGLRSAAAAQPPASATRVDFVAQNIRDVRAGRNTMSKKEQARLAHAQVLASATAHLPSGAARGAPPRRAAAHAAGAGAGAPADDDALLRAALDEIQRGAEVSAYERSTRGPRLAYVGRRKAF